MLKVDLHTHSQGSADGGLSADDYRQALKNLDYIAVTDHNNITNAQALRAKLGPQIIVGSEITSTDGEVVGLFLTQDVPAGLSLAETIERIHHQHGLVLVPHPFERLQRHSLDLNEFKDLVSRVDIIETYNPRSISITGRLKARRFAAKYGVAQAANSDAHGPKGIGRTFNWLSRPPAASNLKQQLLDGRLRQGLPSLGAWLEPSQNRRRAKIRANSN